MWDRQMDRQTGGIQYGLFCGGLHNGICFFGDIFLLTDYSVM